MLLLSWALAGCATTTAATRPGVEAPSGFPSKDALAAVARQPAPELGKAESYADVAEWPLVGPFPDGTAQQPLTGSEPWTEALRTAVAPRAGVTLATQGMQCTARELGAFVLEHGKLPAPALRQFIGARCGAAVVRLSAQWVTGTADPKMPDAELHAAWNAQIAPMYAQLPPGNADVGVVMLRKAEKVVVMRASGERRARVESAAADPSAPGVFVLRAELLTPAASVRVMINRGHFGYGECEVAFQAPLVEARCMADATDAHAWISLAAFPAGRVLGEQVLDTLVWPTGAPADRYTRAATADGIKATSVDAVRSGLMLSINGLRQSAGLEPLVEEASQSATAAEVAPYYFAAQLHQVDETVADVVALGLRAGWEVSGLVKEGQFAASAMSGSDDVGDLVALAIEQPFGRQTLLDPAARRIAIGAIAMAEPQFFGAVIATYAMLEDPSAALTAEVWKRLDEARTSAGHKAFARDDRVDERTAEVRSSLLAGDVDADATLRNLMSAFPGGASGYWIEMRDPRSLEVPAALLRAPEARVAVVVARHRRPGQPWGSFVVFLVANGLIADMTI